MNSKHRSGDVIQEELERRKIRDTRMVLRIRTAAVRVSTEVHTRRLLDWAGTDDGSFPAYADSERIALHEVGVLVRALGEFAAIDHDDYIYSVQLVQRRRRLDT